MTDLYEHHHNQMLLDEHREEAASARTELLRLVADVEKAAADLDPFNQGGAVTHPEHGFECGNDEAAQFNLDRTLAALRHYAEAAE